MCDKQRHWGRGGAGDQMGVRHDGTAARVSHWEGAEVSERD